MTRDDLLIERRARKIAKKYLDPSKQKEAIKALIPLLTAMREYAVADPEGYERLKELVVSMIPEKPRVH